MSSPELPYLTTGPLLEKVLEQMDHIDVHAELSVAREEFYRLRGKPVPADPFYDTFMNLFLEWFLIERPGVDGESPLHHYVREHRGVPEELALHHLLAGHHSLFEVMTPWKKDFFWLRDLVYGDDWLVSHWPPFPGIDPGQPLEGRIVSYGDRVCLTPSVVVFPFSSRDALRKLLASCRDRLPLSDILALLSKMSIRSFRFQHMDPKRFFTLDDPMVRDLLPPALTAGS